MVAIKTTTLAAVLICTASVSATWFHVNRGCILLNQSILCAGNDGARQIDGGSAHVEAKLDQSNHCQKDFSWPSSYGDIYYGADNCLYDSKGQNINGQCC
ncbi:hypothetical protein COCMIDRAFT_10179 [Bipolaris oryzae ATCC 44560]|uniref:Cyanovirin-N domain-containing protein n=1 Tax=Bipolaris oryzae ATCC 44560 TaxID=930090 RepID=W6YQA3_COCMI|nr:uncharacterized protein COCMIDRAFT_10179 [Bipolaris oryzae ATCC 44560]EUC39805.1 hypothetical protein COCMIDRAFT_10179 [Bipolaris oryzae ATCC 44560]